MLKAHDFLTWQLLQHYDLKVTYKTGKFIYIEYNLRLAFVSEKKEQLCLKLKSTPLHTYLCHQNMSVFRDMELQTLQIVVIKSDTKDNTSKPSYLYSPSRDKSTTSDGLLFKGHTIIVY